MYSICAGKRSMGGKQNQNNQPTQQKNAHPRFRGIAALSALRAGVPAIWQSLSIAYIISGGL